MRFYFRRLAGLQLQQGLEAEREGGIEPAPDRSAAGREDPHADAGAVGQRRYAGKDTEAVESGLSVVEIQPRCCVAEDENHAHRAIAAERRRGAAKAAP